jgi:hypothetical protein
MILYSNAKILETNLEREYFTKHGLRLNSPGKECIALRLATMVKIFSTKRGCLLSAYNGKTTL